MHWPNKALKTFKGNHNCNIVSQKALILVFQESFNTLNE